MKRPRDMTRAQFAAALQRHGWRKVLLWIDVGGGRSIGMVMINGKLNRRASLAHAIRQTADRDGHPAAATQANQRGV